MTAGPALVDTFVDGFRDRMHASRKPGQQMVDEPGIVGLLGTSAELLDGRVLVTDDRAADLLRAQLPTLLARVVNVFAAAEQCTELLASEGSYRRESAAAMVKDDLSAIAPFDLPDGLTLRAVPAIATSSTNGEVSLEDAALAALRAEPEAAPTSDLDGFVGYLRAIPNAHYLAATDTGGVVRATAAAANFGPTTGVYFVNTDPEWRGQGIGTSMTAAALRVAAADGAQRAVLDSSALGRSIYLRLGFRVVSENALFVRDD